MEDLQDNDTPDDGSYIYVEDHVLIKYADDDTELVNERG